MDIKNIILNIAKRKLEQENIKGLEKIEIKGNTIEVYYNGEEITNWIYENSYRKNYYGIYYDYRKFKKITNVKKAELLAVELKNKIMYEMAKIDRKKKKEELEKRFEEFLQKIGFNEIKDFYNREKGYYKFIHNIELYLNKQRILTINIDTKHVTVNIKEYNDEIHKMLIEISNFFKENE